MAETLNIRARFPDGQILTFQQLDSTTAYETLLSQLQACKGWSNHPRVLLADRPPKLISVDPLKQLREIMSSGAMLLVEPHADDAAPKSPPKPPPMSRKNNQERGRGQGRSRGRGALKGKKRTQKANGPFEAHVVTLTDAYPKKRQRVPMDGDEDDQNDEDWNASNNQDEGDDISDDSDTKTKKVKSRTGQGRRAVRQHRGKSAEDSAEINGTETSVQTWANENNRDMAAIALDAGLPAAQGRLGAALAASVFDIEGKTDNAISRELRANFADALKKRQAEAEGERRLNAYLARRYEIKPMLGGLKFSVRYRATSERSWTDENNSTPLMCWPKLLLAAVIKEVVKNPHDRLRLRPLDMAAVSPRMFWNLVRLFPDHMENGMRQLVPDGDWSFMDHRQRSLSVKGKCNAMNKQEMGSERD